MGVRLPMMAGVLLGAGAALGQAGWNITPIFAPGQTGITPQTPSCKVRVWARFNRPPDYAVAGMRWDVMASEGDWSQNVVLEPLRVGQEPGVIVGPTVERIIAGQLNFGSFFADPGNPIAAWEAEWTTTHFRPRVVRITTATTRFDVYPFRTSPATSSRLAGLTEGGVELQVSGGVCYPDCDTANGWGVLDIFDFLCWLNRYQVGAPYACDCDTGTGLGVCDVFDFLCFQNAFVNGCP